MSKGNKQVRLTSDEEKIIRFCRAHSISPIGVLHIIASEYEDTLKAMPKDPSPTIAIQVNKWATIVHDAYNLIEELKNSPV